MQNPVKRVAAIHDLSGFGRASLTVVISILSTMGLFMVREMQFISLGVRATFGYLHNANEGILLERILNNLQSSVRLSSYQILD
jgi:pyridoxine kinase